LDNHKSTNNFLRFGKGPIDHRALPIHLPVIGSFNWRELGISSHYHIEAAIRNLTAI
jgi:hypothetical protein